MDAVFVIICAVHPFKLHNFIEFCMFMHTFDTCAVSSLTIPPSMGYEHNPLSVYYCYEVEGSTRSLKRCIAEVCNFIAYNSFILRHTSCLRRSKCFRREWKILLRVSFV